MARPESIINLSERLRKHSRRQGRSCLAVDLRLAAKHLRDYACGLIAQEAIHEPNPVLKQQLIEEAASMRCDR